MATAWYVVGYHLNDVPGSGSGEAARPGHPCERVLHSFAWVPWHVLLSSFRLNAHRAAEAASAVWSASETRHVGGEDLVLEADDYLSFYANEDEQAHRRIDLLSLA